MPLPTFRRRTVDEPLPPQEDRSSPSPSRVRPSSSTGLTPRKSLQSLIGSVRKRGATPAVMTASGGANLRASGSSSATPTPRQSIIEQSVYSSHDRSTTGPAAFQTPSPYPAKVSASTSKAKASKSESPRTFLESLADAIRAPASLFYKENRQKSEHGGSMTAGKMDDTAKVSSEVDSHFNDKSPTKSGNSKKSVRFKRPGSIIKNEPRSSPIDIPKPAPYLPPMNLATTPIMECFGRRMTDPIPTGRPRSPSVLQSTPTFREATTKAQECFKDIIPVPADLTPLGSTVSEDAISPLAKGVPLENPFRTPTTESELLVRRMLQSDKAPSSTEELLRPVRRAVLVHKLAGKEKIQLLPDTFSNETRLATASPSLSLERDSQEPNDSPPTKHTNNSPSAQLPETQDENKENTPGHSLLSFRMNHNDSVPKGAGGKPACPPEGRQIDKKWLAKPTLEDIRGRFQHPDRYDVSSSEQADPFSDEHGCSDPNDGPKDIISPSPETGAGSGPVQRSISALEQQPEAMSPTTRKYLRSSSEGNPISPTYFIQNPPWSSELALRGERSSPAEELNQFVPPQLQGRLSSLASVESHPEGGATLPLEQTEDSIGYLLSGIGPAHQTYPGTTSSREMQTPSPAFIPLPSSRHAPASSTIHFDTSEYESDLWPFEEDSHSNDFFLPPNYDRRGFSANLSSKKLIPSPTDEAAPLLDPNQRFSGFNLEPENRGDVGEQNISGKVTCVTPGEQLEKAAAVLEQFERRNGNGSSEPDNSTSKLRAVAPLSACNTASSVWVMGSSQPGSKTETILPHTPLRSRATTATSSNCATLFSAKSRKDVSTDTTEGMEEDEAMCKGLI
ncbi:hypothetical protein H2200_001415 [Cladophialophora chaetospira]|uniref:Uncharacterized protein n=1 Tax=Cladophialophora chaetospira TaxID=386627 RepID=A0AA39CPK9_9EURO|nr:hypothetical protein H2200_001415 [Cladophialophora chaetospira]